MKVEEHYIALNKVQLCDQLRKEKETIDEPKLGLTNLPLVKGGSFRGRAFRDPTQPYTKYVLVREFSAEMDSFEMPRDRQLMAEQAVKAHNMAMKENQKKIVSRLANTSEYLEDWTSEFHSREDQAAVSASGEEEEDFDDEVEVLWTSAKANMRFHEALNVY